MATAPRVRSKEQLLRVLPCMREGLSLEFKKAKNKLPSSFWQSYSAFANTQGGTIILGIEEQDGHFSLTQLSRDTIDRLIQEFWNNVHNPNTISHCLLGPEDVQPDYELGCIAFRVPQARVTERPVYCTRDPYKGSYKRAGEGDYHYSEQEVAYMQSDARLYERPYDAELLSGYTAERDLDSESLGRYRRLFSQSKPGNPWCSDNDADFLAKVGVTRICRETGQSLLTRAGLLLLGKYESICEAFPTLFLDYREVDDLGASRWAHRLHSDGSWAGNLLSFFLQVYPRLQGRLSRPFRVEQGFRRDDSPEHLAMREALVNALVHADYARPGNLTIEVSKERIRFSNPGDLLITIEKYYAGGYSFCRNPNLQRMLGLIGLSERAGTGVPQIIAGWRAYPRPELSLEHQPDQVVLCFSSEEIVPRDSKRKLAERFGASVHTLSLEETQLLVLALNAGEIRHRDACELLVGHRADISALLRSLRDRGFLLSSGRGKGVCYTLGACTDLAPPPKDRMAEMLERILNFCREPRTLTEIMEHVGLQQKAGFRSRYINPLLEQGALVLEYPDKRRSSNQRYFSVDANKLE